EGLVIVGVAGELGPGLALVEMHMIGPQRLFGEADQGRMHADQVQRRRAFERTGLQGSELGRVDLADLALLLLVHPLGGALGAAEDKLEVGDNRGDLLGREEVVDGDAAVTAPRLQVFGPKALSHGSIRLPHGAWRLLSSVDAGRLSGLALFRRPWATAIRRLRA